MPDYLLEPRALVDLRGLPLSPEILDQLVDVGIATDVDLAGHSAKEAPLLFEDACRPRRRPQVPREAEEVYSAPPNLAGWVAEAQRGLPKTKSAKKDRLLLSQLLGLEPFGTLGPTKAPTQVELARATEGCSQGKLSRLLLAARVEWIHSHLSPRFVHRLARFIHREGGALPLPVLAQRFGPQLTGFDGSDAALRQVSFLIRVACETSDGDRPPVQRRVLKSGVEMIEAVEDMGRELMKLAVVADKLADSTPLPSVQRALATIEAEVERLELVAMLEAAPPPGAALPDEPAPDRSPSFLAAARLRPERPRRAIAARRGLPARPRPRGAARAPRSARSRVHAGRPCAAGARALPGRLGAPARGRAPRAACSPPLCLERAQRHVPPSRRTDHDAADFGSLPPTSPGSPLRLLAPRLDAVSLKQETHDRPPRGSGARAQLPVC